MSRQKYEIRISLTAQNTSNVTINVYNNCTRVIKKDCLSWQFNLEHFVIRLFVILQPDTSFDSDRIGGYV
jgi:hypothetical protein